jgi:hypothetical protein
MRRKAKKKKKKGAKGSQRCCVCKGTLGTSKKKLPKNYSDPHEPARIDHFQDQLICSTCSGRYYVRQTPKIAKKPIHTFCSPTSILQFFLKKSEVFLAFRSGLKKCYN